MKSNHHSPTSEPTALCASFAGLLPVLDEPGINAHAAAQARVHLATCAHCQAEAAIYDQLDAAVRQSWGPFESPRYQTEDVLRPIITDPAPPHVPHRPAPSDSRAPAPLRPGRTRRFLGGLSAMAVILVVVVLMVFIFATHGLGTGQVPGGSNLNLHRVSATELTSISMVSPTEGWAVGESYTDQSTGTPGHPEKDHPSNQVLLLHYSQGVWSPVSLPIAGRLESISMDSATDGWAAGQSTFTAPTGGFLLHYDGQTWTRAAFPDQHSILERIQMLSATDGWAIGIPVQSGASSLWHYDGHVWAEQPLPASLTGDSKNTFTMNTLSMISSTEGWLIGQTAPAQTAGPSAPTSLPSDRFLLYTTIILHYTGGQWEVQKTIPDTLAQSISMDSATDGWATLDKDISAGTGSTPGTRVTPLPFQFTPLLLHYRQGQWVDETSTIRAGGKMVMVGNVTMNSTTDGWIHLGLHQGTVEDPVMLLHYDGAVWTAVSLPTIKETFMSIYDIAMTSPTNGWAVGDSEAQQKPGYDQFNTPLIVHYQSGVWKIVQN